MPEQSPGLRPETHESKNPSNGQKLIEVVDPEGFTICLHLSTWEKHIIRNHPDMADLLDSVKKTLAEPEVIQQTPQERTTYYYYRLVGRKVYRRDDLYVIVVVSRDEESKTGFIKTAHLVDKLRAGENIVWFKRK